MKNLSYILSLVVLIAFGCRKSVDDLKVEEENHVPEFLDGYEPAEELVTGSVFGTVIDETGAAVANATIKFGSTLVNTDTYGSFLFENVEMNKKGTYIDVKKDGYFDTGRRFYPQDGSTNTIKIQLIPIVYNNTFESTAGGTINLQDDGGFIVFSPNSIVDANEEPYTGTVDVATAWLSPDDNSILNRMPGALQGVNLLNEEIGLLTFGMVGVELRGSTGQKLNIAEDATAELHIDVPNSLEAAAPAEIPLWSFNDTYGIWVEESKATLIDGFYVGDVSHFSFWNCDDPISLVYMDLIVIDDASGEPIQGVQVNITTTSGAISTGSGYSDAEGIVAGFIPKDQELILEILSPCGDVVYSQAIGPYDADVSLGEYGITNNSVVIRGEVIGCEGGLVSQGVLIVKVNGQNDYFFLQENPFAVVVPVCPGQTEVMVTGGSLTSLTQGNFITAPIGETVNVGSLSSCGEELLGYMKITVDGITTRYFEINSISQAPDTLTPFVTYIFMSDQSAELAGDTLRASVGFASGGAGYANYAADWSDTDFIDYIIDTENGWVFFDDFDTFIVDEYGPYTGTIVSGYMSGSLTNYYDSQNSTVFVEGSFKAIRDD